MRKWDRVKSSHDPAREAGMRRIIITAITLIWLGGCGDDTPATAKTGSTNDACYMAQKFVSGRLKAPATADFQPCREASMSPQSDGLAGARYSVFSYVDSQMASEQKYETIIWQFSNMKVMTNPNANTVGA
jgi:hypothetical protein